MPLRASVPCDFRLKWQAMLLLATLSLASCQPLIFPERPRIEKDEKVRVSAEKMDARTFRFTVLNLSDQTIVVYINRIHTVIDGRIIRVVPHGIENAVNIEPGEAEDFAVRIKALPVSSGDRFELEFGTAIEFQGAALLEFPLPMVAR